MNCNPNGCGSCSHFDTCAYESNPYILYVYEFSLDITTPDSVTHFSGRLLAESREQADQMVNDALGGILYTPQVRGGILVHLPVKEVSHITEPIFTAAYINGVEIDLDTGAKTCPQ